MPNPLAKPTEIWPKTDVEAAVFRVSVKADSIIAALQASFPDVEEWGYALCTVPKVNQRW